MLLQRCKEFKKIIIGGEWAEFNQLKVSIITASL